MKKLKFYFAHTTFSVCVCAHVHMHVCAPEDWTGVFCLSALAGRVFTTAGFSGGSVVKTPPAMQETQETLSLIPGWGRSHEEGNGPGGSDSKEMETHSNILAWEIPWTKEPEWATVHWVAKSWTQLSN